VKATTENFIGIYEDAFTKEYCDSVIEHFNNAEKAGFTVNRQQQQRNVSKLNKDDTQLYGHSEFSLAGTLELITKFNVVFWEKVYPEYADTFAELKGYANHASYAYKIQKTEIGQGYHIWHSETTNRQLCNRILAWTLYLNDVEEGGETEFLYYPKRVKPKAGTFVLWPAGFTHTHRGNPPISNTKYIVTGWIEF
jgi:hypothetical protein